jgi:hypothetical protein
MRRAARQGSGAALKDIGKELGLEDPFSRTPGSVKISGKAEPVGRPDLIAAA